MRLYILSGKKPQKAYSGVVVILTFFLLMTSAVAQIPAPQSTVTLDTQIESGSLPIGFHIGQGDALHMKAVQNAGGDFAVVVFNWANIEPEPNYVYWEAPDAALRAAEFYGIDLIARLDQPPDWAIKPGETLPFFNVDAYTNFVRRVAERYGNRLAGIILWNEPNTTTRLKQYRGGSILRCDRFMRQTRHLRMPNSATMGEVSL